MPTYLAFSELAGGAPKALTTTGALTLAAISAGAVFMGANSPAWRRGSEESGGLAKTGPAPQLAIFSPLRASVALASRRLLAASMSRPTMKSEMRGAISERKREPLKTP